MGFFDEFASVETAGLSFVSEEEKEVLIDESVALPVVRLFKTETKYGPRFVLVTEIEGEERALGFGCAAAGKDPYSRDVLFENLTAYLDREDTDGEVVSVKMSRIGRYIDIVQADSEAVS